VINDLIDLFTNSSNLFDAFLVNVFKKSVNLFVTVDFLNEVTEELDEIFIFEIDAEEEAVEQSHRVLLDVS
jgi:hypothetical protein